MRDILPPESGRWNYVEDVARKTFRAYAYQEIRTPLVEPTELFARGVGTDTDIVSKEMYTWEDRDKSSLTLRPEATASVMRAYIEHRMDLQPGIKKVYYIGPMFRRERPQKGRYRQFYQIGAEAIGSESPTVDAELIEMLVDMLERFGVEGYALLLNSVGDKNCRPQYLERLRAELAKVREQLCGDCQHRSETNPLRVLDCKVPADQPIIDKLPTILNCLCEACRTHFEKLQSYLRDRSISYTLQPRLVRGLDYYTRTAFEFVHGSLGAQNSLLGGGRYDGLSEDLGGLPAPGIGFSIGEDRLVLTLQESHTDEVGEGSLLGSRPPTYIRWMGKSIYIVWMGNAAYSRAAKIARSMRSIGNPVELAADDVKLKKSLETASKMGARYVVIIGERELQEGRYLFRNMISGEQTTKTEQELYDIINNGTE